VSAARQVASAFALAALLAGCESAETPAAAQRIGEYAVRQTAEGLEIRSLPDQHPRLNQILARLHPRLAGIGLPSVVLSPARIVDRGSLGQETEWPRSELATIDVHHREKRGVEAKAPEADRSWRVLLRRKDGRTLRGFGFASESDARAFAAAAGSALGIAPQATSGRSGD